MDEAPNELARARDGAVAMTAKPALDLTRVGASARIHGPRDDIEALAAFETQLSDLARDPDIYALVIRPTAPVTAAAAASAAAGRLAWRLECFSKPTVSLIDGPVSGFVAGLVLCGTHRVAGEGYRLEIDPVALAEGADGGLVHALARLGPRGAWLGLTARRLDRFEAHRLGLVTHCIDARAFPDIEARLAEADPVDPLLDQRHVSRPEVTRPEEPPELAGLIARTFEAATLTEIKARLATEAEVEAPFAAATLSTLNAHDAASLEAALQRLRRAARHDLRETLIDGYRAARSAHGGAEDGFTLPARAEHQVIRGRAP